MSSIVTIIIPIFNAYEDTKKCIESVVEHTTVNHHILLINDASTDLKINILLEKVSLEFSHINVIQNSENLGFVRTCNRSFSESDQSTDVVLLNSDTIVTPNWLEKLTIAAYSNTKIATVTPLTNNGTICSIPIWLEYNDIPAGYTVISFANLIEEVSCREYPQIPTAVGFCMYIKRNVLDEVGYFDAVHFGLGYGEENDFCCRASKLGYLHIIDDSTFVYHSGSKSFGEKKSELIEKNLKILSKLHPNYLTKVSEFINEKPIQKIIDNIELNLFLSKVKGLFPICFILHNSIEEPANSHLGGTEYHCAALIEELRNKQPIYVLYFDRYRSAISLTIFYEQQQEKFYFPLDNLYIAPYLSQNIVFSNLFTDIIRYFQPSIIHIHHLIGLPIRDVFSVLTREKIPYIISIHDYYLICPSYNLIDYKQKFCYEYKTEEYCQKCSQKRLGESYGFKQKWSSICLELLENAQLVITPSFATASYISREYKYTNSENNIKVIRHGVFKQEAIKLQNENKNIYQKSDNRLLSPFKVGFVGSIDVVKGAKLIIELIEKINVDDELKSKFEFHFFGRCSENIPIKFSNVKVTEQYERQDLYKLLKDIDVVVFPTIWPETYCLTADEVLLCGIPIISSPIGAIAERIKSFNIGWISSSSSPEDLLNTLLLVISSPDNYNKVKTNISKYSFISYEEMAYNYLQEYQQIAHNIRSNYAAISSNQKCSLTHQDIFELHHKRMDNDTSFLSHYDTFKSHSGKSSSRYYSVIILIKNSKAAYFFKKNLPWMWKFIKINIFKKMTDKLL